MAHPGSSRPEPIDDRPSAWDITGDVWQRQGPAGSASWWCATDQGREAAIYGHGRTWDELNASILGPMVPAPPPRFGPPPPYTEAISLGEATTLPILAPCPQP